MHNSHSDALVSLPARRAPRAERPLSGRALPREEAIKKAEARGSERLAERLLLRPSTYR